MASLKKPKYVITLQELDELADQRRAEANLLLQSEHYSGSMFLGGCSLECLLKAAVCATLRLEGLPVVFKTHDLEALLLYSSFRSELEQEHAIRKSFVGILDEWKSDGREELLYGRPSLLDEHRSKRFFACLNDDETGVFPWLRSRISKPR
jgi:hypothetical protein